MSRVKKNVLDLGTGPDKIGTAEILQDDVNRHLVTPEPQTFGGTKTFAVPPNVAVAPLAVDDAVPKFGLQDSTRCLANPYIETLTITADDIANGYIQLSKDLAPGQGQSLEIMDFPGAVGLTLGKDYGAQEADRLVFTGYNLGNSGMLIPGQLVTVKYNICVNRASRADSAYIDLSELWMMEPVDPESIGADRENSVNGIAQHAMLSDAAIGLHLDGRASGKTLYFRNARTFERMSLPLPALAGENEETYRLFTAGGKFHLCQLPVLKEYPPLPSIEDGNDYSYISPPFFFGQYKCYRYDGNGWIEAFSAAVDPELANADPGSRMRSRDRWINMIDAPYPVMDIVPWGPDKIGLVASWSLIPAGSDENLPAKTAVRVLNSNYEQEERLVLQGTDDRTGRDVHGYCVAKGADGEIAAKGRMYLFGSMSLDDERNSQTPILYPLSGTTAVTDSLGGETLDSSKLFYKRDAYGRYLDVSHVRTLFDNREGGYVNTYYERLLKNLSSNASPYSRGSWVLGVVNGSHILADTAEDLYFENHNSQKYVHSIVSVHIPTQTVQNLYIDYFVENLTRLFYTSESYQSQRLVDAVVSIGAGPPTGTPSSYRDIYLDITGNMAYSPAPGPVWNTAYSIPVLEGMQFACAADGKIYKLIDGVFQVLDFTGGDFVVSCLNTSFWEYNAEDKVFTYITDAGWAFVANATFFATLY